MLTTGAFIRMGYVRGNLMVNVQPKNAKLLDRSIRIIETVTGASPDRAASMLRFAGNNVLTAIRHIEKEKNTNG